jgi:hypothetical protein
MKSRTKLVLLLALLGVPLLSHGGPITHYSIWDEGDKILTDIPGATIGGVKDAWEITLPQGWDWNGRMTGEKEPRNPARFNFVGSTSNEGMLLWAKDSWTHDPNLRLPTCATFGAHTAAGLPVRIQIFDREKTNCVPDPLLRRPCWGWQFLDC